jgi:hypothetical protein
VVLKPALLVALVVAGLAVATHPWAIPFPGRDTLSGEWIGELRSSAGPRAWLYVALEPGNSLKSVTSYVLPNPRYNAPPSAPLAGRAAVCTRRIGRLELDLRGYTRAWSGERLELLLQPVRQSPPQLRFDLSGEWRGATLDLLQEGNSLAEILGDPGDRLGETGPRVLTAAMAKGTAQQFGAACAALR